LNANAVLVMFQKFHRELCLLLLVLFGLACGQLAATIFGMVLHPDSALEIASRPATRSVNPELSDRDLALILKQNIFDPSARGNSSATFKPSRLDPSAKSPRGDLALIGTLVSGAESTALLKVDKKIKLFHLEDPLPGGGHVETIHRNRVIIRNQDESTTELLLNEAAETSTPVSATPPSNAGVRSTGDNRWQISQSTADAARTNIAEQLRLAQLEPRITNGRTDGFLVRKLERKSLLTQMGLRRGDVILRVNDMSLDSPDKALQLLQQLREARQLTVDLERKNKPLTFAYEIH
jgi:general secretion pathway protein C